ncbi:hypothetical protein C1H46_017546 [Malus baccata]|uniref:Uncharacterized protein n=1 Tax=Malus baccata TaxID=106549 RepID=A0A540MDN0_MALBA|nr:hypothetical protein C1H46_017546 [Malus baccata]
MTTVEVISRPRCSANLNWRQQQVTEKTRFSEMDSQNNTTRADNTGPTNFWRPKAPSSPSVSKAPSSPSLSKAPSSPSVSSSCDTYLGPNLWYTRHISPLLK